MSIQKNKMNTSFKMQWLVDDYKNNELDYEIYKTCKDFGTICMPTGYGKSGVIIRDVIHQIDAIKTGEKLVINISCPILKLTQQMFNDLFEVFISIYGTADNFEFYINSSDNGDNYKLAANLNLNVKKFRTEFGEFKNSNANIAIIATCHRSLGYFVEKLADIKQYTCNKDFADNTIFVSYLDEAHLFDPNDKIEYYNDEDFSKVNLKKLVANSDKCYAFSATPDKEITNILNNKESKEAAYIIHKHALNAIKENIIVPPVFHYTTTSEDRITATIAEQAAKNALKSNPDIIHKILITCNDSEHLINLRKELETKGYKVFSICCNYGTGITKDNIENVNIVKFIEEVDKYDETRICFVLHIRQLIQGIDIKSLTDTVIYNANTKDNLNFRKFIQIIGRVLRTAEGERGVDIDNRTKKFGNVYFVNKDENAQSDLANFFMGYYGTDCLEYAAKKYKDGVGQNPEDKIFQTMICGNFSKTANDNDANYVYNELEISVKEYMKNCELKYKLFAETGNSFDAELEVDKQRIYEKLPFTSFKCSELINYTNVINEIGEIMRKYLPHTNPCF